MAEAIPPRNVQAAELREALQRRGARITLLGPAGIGKSHLARSVLDSLGADPSGVLWVDLGARANLTGVQRALSEALASPKLPHGADERQIADELRARARTPGGLLLCFDNAELAVDALREWLEHSAFDSLSVLTTAREALRIEGERLIEVQGLSLAEAADLLRAMPNGAEVSLEQVARWVERFEGLPLALEVIGSWLPYLTPAQLERHFSAALPRANGGSAFRHESLSAAVQASWEGLSDDARVLLSCGCHWPGGFDLALACEVTRLSPPEVLEAVALCERHALVRRQTSPRRPHQAPARWSLHAALRECIASRPEAATLQSACTAAVLSRLARAELRNFEAIARGGNVAERVCAFLALHHEYFFHGEGGHLEDMTTLVEVAGNDAAVERASEDLALARAEAMRFRGKLSELEMLLDSPSFSRLLRTPTHGHASSRRDLSRGRAHALAGWLMRVQGDLLRARNHYEHAVRALREDAARCARALSEWAFLQQSDGDLAGAADAHRRALQAHLEAGDMRGAAIERSYLAVATHRMGRYDEAEALHAEARAALEQQGLPRYVAAEDMHQGHIWFERGDLTKALACYRSARERFTHVGERALEGIAHAGIALALAEQGALNEAAVEAIQAEQRLLAVGGARWAALAARCRARVSWVCGDYRAAEQEFCRARALSDVVTVGHEPLDASYLALLAFAKSPDSARELATAARTRLESSPWEPSALCAVAVSQFVAGALTQRELTARLRELTSSDARHMRRLFPEAAKRVELDRDGRWVKVEGRTFDLRRRAAVRRMVIYLLERAARAPQETTPLQTLIEVGWPDEKISFSAAQKRAYTAIWTIRTELLGEHLETQAEGYRVVGVSLHRE